MAAPASIADYLRMYGSTLGEHVLARFPALHSPDDPVWPALKQLKRRPFPAQAMAIMGIVKCWQDARCAAAVAECGTGKTLISLGSVFTHASGLPFTCLAMVPPQLVEKWCREAVLTLPGVRVFVIDAWHPFKSSVVTFARVASLSGGSRSDCTMCGSRSAVAWLEQSLREGNDKINIEPMV